MYAIKMGSIYLTKFELSGIGYRCEFFKNGFPVLYGTEEEASCILCLLDVCDSDFDLRDYEIVKTQRVKPVPKGRMSRERFELYRDVRSHARADGYVHCEDCTKDGCCRLQDIDPFDVNEFEFCALFQRKEG